MHCVDRRGMVITSADNASLLMYFFEFVNSKATAQAIRSIRAFFLKIIEHMPNRISKIDDLIRGFFMCTKNVSMNRNWKK